MDTEKLGSLEINKIHHTDCVEGMKLIPSNSVDLVITSPPYNIGKAYESKVPIDNYIKWSQEYLTEIYRVLKPGRSFLFQVGQYVDKQSNNIPITYLLYETLLNVGFKLRQEIIWHFKGGMPAKRKLTGQNEKLMWLYKGDILPFFDLDSIRVKEWQAFDKRNNPNGKNPTDVWEFNRVTGNSKEKTNHPCQFPTSMIERVIKGWSSENEIILDPFIGSGTTAITALKTNRKYIGFELSPEYIEIANERIAKEEGKWTKYKNAEDVISNSF